MSASTLLSRRTIAGACMIVLGTSGCASSSLRLSLQMYRGDPAAQTALSAEQATELTQGLARASSEIDRIAQDRLATAQRLYATYVAALKYARQARSIPDSTPMGLEIESKRLTEFNQAVNEQAARAHQKADSARNLANEYVALREKGAGRDSTQTVSFAVLVKQAELQKATRAVDAAVARLRGPLGTDFERGFVASWSSVSKMADVPIRANRADSAALRTLRGALIDSARALTNELRRQAASQDASTADVQRADAIIDSAQVVGNPPQVVRLVSRSVASIPVQPVGGGQSVGMMLDRLAANNMAFSQIDRLKDPADRMWRTISDPSNDKFWKEEFTRTAFSGHGKGEVVVVRDTPIDYRVQQASNNPAALIQGQLQISRAIAGAAITVLGAVPGVSPVIPTKKADGVTQAGAQADGNTTESAEQAKQSEEQLAARRATVDEEATLRRMSLSALRRELESIRTTLNGLTDGQDEQRKATLAQLRSVLDAYQRVFNTPAPSTTP